MLCDICRHINVEELLSLDGNQDGGTSQHALYSDLEGAAKAGCSLCQAIESMAIASVSSQPARYNHLRRFPVRLKMRRRGRADAQYQGASQLFVTCGAALIAQFEAYVSPESDVVRSGLKLISGRPIASDAVSDATFSIARAWISECMTSDHHSRCRGTAGSDGPVQGLAFMPTRLIDLGPSDGRRAPRLVNSFALSNSDRGPYAALSHCWGGTDRLQIDTLPPDLTPNRVQPVTAYPEGQWRNDPRPPTTLTSNLSDRQKSISMEALPKTFRDAVIIARKLGLRYLWIDSLCIIQDSPSDWEQEASQMANIYKSSYVTIAAEWARNSHTGILRDRLLDFDPIELPFNSEMWDIHTTVFLRQVRDDWQTSIIGEKSALHSRAWVLQESMLAPRTIHFGSQQMFWECRTSSYAEGDTSPIPPIPTTEQGQWIWSRNKSFITDSQGKGQEESLKAKDILYMRWYAIVEEFSKRKMTYLSDVFPALAGLATEFNSHIQDQYVAGLWKADLLRGLLWSVVDPETSRAAVPYRAPSWSWASIIGEVRSPRECLYTTDAWSAEILGTEVTLGNPSSTSVAASLYGQVSCARLRLRGRWICPSHWPTFEYEPWKGSKLIQNPADKSGYSFRTFDLGSEEFIAERYERKRSLGLLELGSWRWNPHPGPEAVVHCLILESANDIDHDLYRRIGVVEMHSTDAGWMGNWLIREVIVI
ncbi:MAG: hypothetical protein M1818_008441 [Claussenomyces sp. TS43310]|nr:MAG: hypothetical protein M1818_008441 [Claussenomyces sp. TS43310]